jgi:hypothetical protein
MPLPAELVLKSVLSAWQSRQSLSFNAGAAAVEKAASTRIAAMVKILLPTISP